MPLGGFNSECSQCRERVQKDALSCEDRFSSLQSKYQKLALVTSISAGVVGKEIVEEVASLFETAAPIVETITEPEIKLSQGTGYTQPLPYDNVLFANVPPLTPRLTLASTDYNFSELYLYENSVPEPSTLFWATIFF